MQTTFIFVLITYIVLFIETIKYAGLLTNYFFPPVELFILTSFILFFKNILLNKKISIIISNFLLLIVVLSGLLSFFFTFLEISNFENYVFSTFGLHYSGLAKIFFFSQMIWLLSQSKQWWNKYAKLLIFIAPILIILNLLLVRFWPMNYFLELIKEDRLIEYSQFFIMIFASLISFSVFHLMKKNNDSLLSLFFFVLLGLALLLIALEEISFGQRLLGLETPNYLLDKNTQQEINFHNIKFIGDQMGVVYLFVGLYGGLAWIVERLLLHIKKIRTNISIRVWMERIVPSSILSLYFLSKPAFYLIQNQGYQIGAWAEVVELLLYLGIMMHLFKLLFFTRYSIEENNKRKSKNCYEKYYRNFGGKL